MTFFYNHYLLTSFLAGMFTFLITILGASVIFLFKKINSRLENAMMGIAGGVMLAASFFSLLSPALDICSSLQMISWLNLSVGFILGGAFLYWGDIFISKKEANCNKKSKMLIFSITLHNIPEGLAVGVAYGLLKYNFSWGVFVSALLITLGIGLQNFPEGTAVAMPILADGKRAKDAFKISSLTGIVEPIFSLVGALLASKVQYIMPVLLSFAAGAMIYVVICEIIPEASNKKVMTIYSIIGFTIMMILDVALG